MIRSKHRWAALVVFVAGIAVGNGASVADKATNQAALVFAIDDVVRGQRVGTTIFENRVWEETGTGFDANAVALIVAGEGLTRSLLIVDGSTEGSAPKGSVVAYLSETKGGKLDTKMAALCEAWDVDVIHLVETVQTRDWMGNTSQYVEGIGLYLRSFGGMRQSQAYCALRVRTFDRKKRRFTRTETEFRGQQVPRIGWHDTWQEYTAYEQRTVLQAVDRVMRDGTRALLAKVDLMDASDLPADQSSFFVDRRARGTSWIPDGNELEIPPGISPEQARDVVVESMIRRGWSIPEPGAAAIVGVIVEGEKEASVTATFTATTITLVSKMHKVGRDGTRVEIKPNERWHRNLKATILQTLMKDAAELPVPAGPAARGEEAATPGVSAPASGE